MNDPMDWIDKREEEIQEERDDRYFEIVEGKQEFVLLSHLAPLAQVWDGTKYRIAEEGDKNVSIKGLGWVMQDGKVKQAKLPYVVVKDIRSYQQNPEWEFKLPFPHTFSLTAKGAKTKDVEYTLNASPKKVEIPVAILEELAKKPKPEAVVEKIKEGRTGASSAATPKKHPSMPIEYPTEQINPDDIPF
jgi:hypothetical protein